jgi:hypothetical protein
MRDDIRLKIEWAKHHFRELYSVIRSFVRPNPYRILVQRDPQTREVLYCVSNDVAVPRDIGLRTGDVIQNLRTAPDYLGCALVTANGGVVTNRSGFPILDNPLTAPHEQKMFARKVKGMSSTAVDLIPSINAYKGGNDILWRLHALNNIDKHRLLVTVGACMGSWSITQHIDATDMPLEQMERVGRAFAADNFADIMRVGTFPLEKGKIVWADPPDAKENPNFKFEAEVAMNEPGICEGAPVVTVLSETLREVAATIQFFDGLY